MLPISTSSEEDWRSAEPPPRGAETAEWASDPRERATDLAGEDLLDPAANHTSAAAAPPRRKRGQHREERWWKLPPQRELSRSEAYAVAFSQNADSRLSL